MKEEHTYNDTPYSLESIKFGQKEILNDLLNLVDKIQDKEIKELEILVDENDANTTEEEKHFNLQEIHKQNIKIEVLNQMVNILKDKYDALET